MLWWIAMRRRGRVNAVDAVLALARERPELGVVRAARELRRRGVRLSPSGVRAIWARHDLGTTYQRLMLRKRDAGRRRRPPLSASQRALFERMRVSRRVLDEARGNPTGKLRRERLIWAAARVIDKRGYEGTTLREVCAAAGILPGSLYYHFKSKEDLIIQVHGEGFRQLNEAVDRALARETDPWCRLEAACAAHLTLLVGVEERSLVTGTSLFHTAPPGLQRRLNRDRHDYEERYREMLAALPLPDGVDPTLLRLALLGALNWTRIWYRPGKKTPADIARHLVHSLLRQRLCMPIPT
jgi:AcrR family transcriptional regulator